MSEVFGPIAALPNDYREMIYEWDEKLMKENSGSKQ
jgi:hypothetical protein